MRVIKLPKIKLRKMITCICCGFCSVDIVMLFIGFSAIVCDGFLSLILYSRVLGFSANQLYATMLVLIVLGFIVGVIIGLQDISRKKRFPDKIYVDSSGNEYEIIKGVKDKDGIPYVIAIDYPEKTKAVAYTLNHFNLMFKEKDM